MRMGCPLIGKRGITIVNAFQKIISKGHKPNKTWLDQGSGFYNNLFKRFLKINNIEIYSTYKEAKPVAAERFITNLKNKIFKHISPVSKNVYLDVLDDIVNKYNNTGHRTITMNPTDVTSDFYAEYNEDSNENDPKFNVGDRVGIPKSKNFFAKRYTQNWSEEVFIVSKMKITAPWRYAISDLNSESITGSFYEKELRKLVRKNLEKKK